MVSPAHRPHRTALHLKFRHELYVRSSKNAQSKVEQGRDVRVRGVPSNGSDHSYFAGSTCSVDQSRPIATIGSDRVSRVVGCVLVVVVVVVVVVGQRGWREAGMGRGKTCIWYRNCMITMLSMLLYVLYSYGWIEHKMSTPLIYSTSVTGLYTQIGNEGCNCFIVLRTISDWLVGWVAGAPCNTGGGIWRRLWLMWWWASTLCYHEQDSWRSLSRRHRTWHSSSTGNKAFYFIFLISGVHWNI